MRLAFCFDFETYSITPGLQHPPAICMSYAIVDRETLAMVNWGVVEWRDGLALLDHAVSQGWYMVGANTAFDVMVAQVNAPDVGAATRRWIDVYRAARVTDVLLRQRLLDGAVDKHRRLHKHSLASVYKHWSGRTLAKNETIRLGFDKLDGVPVSQYPREYYDYSLSDAIATAWVFICQEYAQRGSVSPHNGVNYRAHFTTQDLLCDQHRQAMKALAIEDMTAVGLRTNPETVEKFAVQLRAERDELLKILVPYGLVRREFSLDVDAVVARFESLGIAVPRLASARPSITQKLYAQIGGRDAELAATQRIRGVWSWPDTAAALADSGSDLVSVTYVKSEAAARRAVELVYLTGGCFDATRGEFVEIAADEEPNRAETVDPVTRRVTLGDVKIDADNCDRTGHKALAAFARYASIVKTLGSDIELMRQAAVAPFHAHYVTLKDNGRTATGSDGGEGTAGNVQNMPRTPGVRECWVPPKGWLFAEADFAAAELSTFAQVALWWIGWSECANMIRDKVDQHSAAGALLINVSSSAEHARREGWKIVKQRKKDGDTEASDARTGGKGINFGCKARMSAKRYKKYAWNNYGLKLTLAEAQRCITIHNELIAEMSAYTAKCESFARNPGKFGSLYDLIHPWSGRVRAGLKFTDVHNYPFSGLAQDFAAVALWDLYCAKWGASELGFADPFYGCHPCLFVHDAIVSLVPEEINRANAAAKRMGEIMTTAARKVLPDVGCEAAPNLLRQLSKKADDPAYFPLFDDAGVVIPIKENGKLYAERGLIKPFDVWEACREDAASTKRPAEKSVRQWLTDREWPGYVIDDVLRERKAA